MASPTLYYIHDPMCSWCWGFRPVWHTVQTALANKVDIQYLLGGLAADSDSPMPTDMQANIKDTWVHIQQVVPGTIFNFDFWIKNQPRRSTYPSCRAVIAAGLQEQKVGLSNCSELMLHNIQKAYYLEAKNPSNNEVLIQLAIDMGLDGKKFADDLTSDQCEFLLQKDLQRTEQLGIRSFPTLMLSSEHKSTLITIDYNRSDSIISNILDII